MTEEEQRQAEIEAWLIIRNASWNQFLTSWKRLAALGVKQNLSEFLKALDRVAKTRYTIRQERVSITITQDIVSQEAAPKS